MLDLIGRKKKLFEKDISTYEKELKSIVSSSTFLVIGGAGSIGQAVVKEIFKRNPKKLHVVDISENNMVELVRDIRSSYGYIDGEFATFALDIGSLEYDAFIKQDGKYDYVLNLSALKHVRSEKDPYTLMRMIETNIFNTDKTLKQAIKNKTKKYFCVSTDKAANPVNMMGASKRIMEMFVHRNSQNIDVSMARFANVAFSDGSLGSYYKTKHTGTFSKVSAFSFNGNKIITSGGGGVIVTDDEVLAKKAKHLTATAKVPHPYEYEHDIIGYNYRMPNLNASLLVAQLEQVDKFVKNKRDLALKYKEFFNSYKDIEFIKEPQDAKSNYWLQAVLLKDKDARDKFLDFTNKNGIMSRPIWKLMSELEMFKDCQKDDLKNSIYLQQRVVNISSSVVI